MKQVLEKVIYYVFTLFILILLGKMTFKVWEAFVPWNYKTDLIGLFFVMPLLVAVSFILAGLSIKVLRKSG
ncbi:hypothetical protein QTG56_02135 [Rossellomorea sp. AcN35-11]|nr:hypothetical protein [Rossellomorea aquimaris]WJV29982.1 hypothetical protein QTG56_02135 [Rossellomorea sp. AcN35-11]